MEVNFINNIVYTVELAKKLKLKESGIDPDTLYREDPNSITFSWHKKFGIQKDSYPKFTHAKLSDVMRKPYMHDEEAIIINSDMPTPVNAIDGRFGYLRDEKGKKYPIISFWNDRRFHNDVKYYNTIVSVLHKLLKFDVNDLIITAGNKVVRYDNKQLGFSDSSPEDVRMLDLKRRYHMETDPLKKRELGLMIGMVPVTPSKVKMPVIGDSYNFNNVIQLIESVKRMNDFSSLPSSAPYGFVVFPDGTFVPVFKVFGHARAAGTDYEGMYEIMEKGGMRMSSVIDGSYWGEIEEGKVTSKAKKTANDLAQLYKYDLSITQAIA